MFGVVAHLGPDRVLQQGAQLELVEPCQGVQIGWEVHVASRHFGTIHTYTHWSGSVARVSLIDTVKSQIASEGRCQGFLDFGQPANKMYGRAPAMVRDQDWVWTLPVDRSNEGPEAVKSPTNLWLSLARCSFGQPWGPSDQDWHLPVFDVDIPRTVLVDNDIQTSSPSLLLLYRPKLARWVPSTTPGHHHVYVDWPVKWWEYQEFLEGLYLKGVIEEGYLNASIERGYTAVRKEGVRKEGVPPTTGNSFREVAE